jgi:ABC-type multidrug transport system permease subunit
MLKKEFRDTLKILLECFLILLAIPLAKILDKLVFHLGWSFRDVFDITFIVILFVFSIFSGIYTFQSEKKDRGFEYLLSLPIKRSEIIFCKIFPRLSILLLLLAVTVIFSISGIPLQGFITVITLQLSAVFLTLAIDSLIIHFIGIFILFTLFQLFSNFIFHFTNNLGVLRLTSSALFGELFSSLILLIPLGISFILSFKNFDLKPLKFHTKPYLFITLPAIAMQILILSLYYNKFILVISH